MASSPILTISLLFFALSLSMVAAPSFPSSLILQPLKPSSNPLLPQPNPRLLTPFSSPLRSSAAEPKPPPPPPPRRKAMEGGSRGRNPRRRTGSYGTSRRSVIKKSFSQEQVVFATPPATDPVVAVIGGGVSGLVCAATLEERGIRSVVFDTVSVLRHSLELLVALGLLFNRRVLIFG